MKIKTLTIIQIAFLLLLTSLVLGCSDGSGPEKAVKVFLSAMENTDVEKMESRCTKEYFDQCNLAHYPGGWVSYKIQTELIYEDAENAQVKVDFHLDYVSLEFREHIITTVDLIKLDNKWILSSGYLGPRDSYAELEHDNVQLSVRVMMAKPEPDVLDLKDDSRIKSYASSFEHATSDMCNGGLVEIESDSLASDSDPLKGFRLFSPIEYLEQHSDYCHVHFKYWVEADGTVHQIIPD